MKAHELALRYLFLQSITWNDVKKVMASLLIQFHKKPNPDSLSQCKFRKGLLCESQVVVFLPVK